MPNKDNYGAEIGQRITCQVCGNQIFLAQTGYNTMDAARDDRHSFLDIFEPVPEGWNINHNLGGWVCSFCNVKFARIIEKFKSELNHTTLQRELQYGIKRSDFGFEWGNKR